MKLPRIILAALLVTLACAAARSAEPATPDRAAPSEAQPAALARRRLPAEAAKLLADPDQYAMEANPRVVAWLEWVIDRKAGRRIQELVKNKELAIERLRIPEDQLDTPEVRELIREKDNTGAIQARLDRVYRGLQKAAVSSLKARLELLSERDEPELGLTWLREHLFETACTRYLDISADDTEALQTAVRALEIVRSFPAYEVGRYPEAEAALNRYIERFAEKRVEGYRDRLKRRQQRLDMPVKPVEGLTDAEAARLDDATLGVVTRLRELYLPILATDDLAERMKQIPARPGPKRTVGTDLTLARLIDRSYVTLGVQELDIRSSLLEETHDVAVAQVLVRRWPTTSVVIDPMAEAWIGNHDQWVGVPEAWVERVVAMRAAELAAESPGDADSVASAVMEIVIDGLIARLDALVPAEEPDRDDPGSATPKDLTLKWVKGRVANYVRLERLGEFEPFGSEWLQKEIEAIFDLGPRTVGHAGHEPVRQHVARRFREAGLDTVRIDHFDHAAPVDEGASVEILGSGSEPLLLYAIWPNQSVPSMTPDEGIEGHVMAMGHGELTDADGKDIEGAIVLMEFDSLANWQWAAMLGAKAVVFLDGDGMTRKQATWKWISLPVNFPRYYADAATSARLKAVADGKTRVRIKGSMEWKRVACGNVIGMAPRRRAKELRDELGAGMRNAVRDAIAGGLEQGTSEVAKALLAAAREADVDDAQAYAEELAEEAIVAWPEPVARAAVRVALAADKAGYGRQLAERVKTLLKLQEAVVVTAPLDSMACAPRAPHGADQSSALVGLEAMAHYLSKEARLPRDWNLIFVAMDAQFQGMGGGRSLGRIIKYETSFFADRVAERRRKRRALEIARQILDDPLGYDYDNNAPSHVRARDLLRETIKRQMDFRRIAVVTALRQLKHADWSPRKVALAAVKEFYIAVGALDSLRAVIEALVLVDGRPEKTVDELLAAYENDVKMAELEERFDEQVATVKDLKKLPPEVIDLLKASLVKLEEIETTEQSGERDVTLKALREDNADRLAVAERHLIDATENAELSQLINGIPRAEAAELAQLAEKVAGAKEAGARDITRLERALAMLAGGAQTLKASYSLDLASHTKMITLGRNGSAAFASSLPSKFVWTTINKLSQTLIGMADFYNEVLDLSDGSLFVDTASLGVGAHYTAADSCTSRGVFALANITAYTLLSVEEPKQKWNTPADVPDRVDAGGLSVQVKTAAALLEEILSGGDLVLTVDLKNRHAEVRGQTVEFDIRAGPFPDMPVPDSLVYLIRGGANDKGGKGDLQCGGAIAHYATLSDHEGWYRIPFETRKKAGESGQTKLWAYKFDYPAGRIGMAADMAGGSAVAYRNVMKMNQSHKAPELRHLLLFDSAAAVIFNPVDPRYFRELKSLQLLDGKGKSAPRHYSYLTLQDTQNKGSQSDPAANCAVAFVEPNVHVQALMGLDRLGSRRLVLVGTTEDRPLGRGLDVGQGRLIQNTPLQVATDMGRINRYRLGNLRRSGIRSVKLDELLERTEGHLDAARAAGEENRHSEVVRRANAAWGYAARAYPEVRGTANDAVYGVVFFLALLLPFAYFMERLTFQGKTAIKRVIGMIVWFAIVFTILYFVHPAFEIAATPFVIVLAFLLLVLASVVLVLISVRFSEQVRKWREKASGAHTADVSRLSTTAVAFNLGIANLGKRKSRTLLTIVTLTLLAFSVISFTSIQQASDYVPVRLAKGTPYEGVMFRMPLYQNMPSSVVNALKIEFTGQHRLVRRGWKMEAEGGWNALVAGKNEMPITRVDRPDVQVIVKCIAGYEAGEKYLTGIDRTVTAGRWFEDEDLETMILPEPVAAKLEISAEDVKNGAVKVMHAGRTFRVVGLARVSGDDAGPGLKDLEGLNGESIAPIDYLASGVKGGGPGRLDTESDVGNEAEFQHLSFGQVAIVPTDQLTRMTKGEIKSVCVQFAEGSDGAAIVDELMNRLAINVFAGFDGQRFLIRSVGMKTVKPHWTLIAPIILAVLIILNTMLGTVEERKGEIAMLGAVGLAPRHVSALFFTEASVYANAGVVVGYLAGQVIAKLVVWQGWFAELSLNYSSTAALFTAALVAFIVLAATVYPARKAAKLATPSGAARWAMPEPRNGRRLMLDLPFTLTRGNAVGMAAFLHEYFEAHADPTSPDFSASGLRTRSWISEDRAALALQMMIYPTPYDLGVSQRCRVVVFPTDRPGVYGVRFSLRRLSSDEASWMRTNFRFMDLIRKQFLIWRTIRLEDRRNYIERGLELFR